MRKCNVQTAFVTFFFFFIILIFAYSLLSFRGVVSLHNLQLMFTDILNILALSR